MDLARLIDISYLFQSQPAEGFSWPFRIVLLVIFIGALVLAIYSGLRAKKTTSVIKRVWSKFQLWGWSAGLVGLLLFSFRELQAIYIGARVYILAWLIIIFIWFISILFFVRKSKATKEARVEKDEEYNKWLPK